MAFQQSVRPEETPMDTEMADQNNNTESAPPQQQMGEQNTQKQDEKAAPAAAPAVESTNNQTQKQGETPPFPYQHQPLEEQKSSDYAPYPKFNEEASHQKQQEVQRQERQGTPNAMGAPAHPDAHPDNKEAASGNLTDTEDTYVQNSLPEVPKGKLSFADVKEFSQKMEIIVTHLWGHLTSGSSVSDTAIGRLSAGTRLLTHGGFEGVFKAAFPSEDKDEGLRKTYACFLSTSTGPVAGTIFISNKRLAFCSDRPLRYIPPTATPAEAAQGHAPPAEGNGNAKGEKEGDNSCYSYYKVAIPIEKIREVLPSENPKKAAEKYIELVTEDNFEFWFMGFVNYDKGVKSMQAAVNSTHEQEQQQSK